MTASLRIVAIMKDEEQAIIEWVAYHRTVGVDDIWIYDNDSTDRTSEILAKLQEKGYIKYIPWPCQSGSPQLLAYAHALELSRNTVRWLAFIDADEFLVPLKGENIVSVFDDIDVCHKNVVGIGVHWKTFGSSNLQINDRRLVLERFDKCAPGSMTPNNCIKTVAKPAFVKEVHIHSCEFLEGNYIDELGRPLQLRQRGMDDRVTHEFIQINHYMVKSKEEFLKKRARGNGNRSPTDKDKYDRFSEDYWNKFDINVDEDNTVKKFIPAVKELMLKMP